MPVQSLNPVEPEGFSSSFLSDLLPSEWKLLLLIAKDLSNEEIVEIMFIAPKTVETYLTRIREKLEIRGKGRLSRFARKNKEALMNLYNEIYPT